MSSRPDAENPDPGASDRKGGDHGRSRPVVSNQPGVHPRLCEVVRRHADTRWQAPLHRPTERVFAQLVKLMQGLDTNRSLVIDAGCGTGVSTRRLAKRYPDALVLGLDQSAARLSRVGAQVAPRAEGNVLWARVELASFWRLALDAGWRVQRHYLLYPNPWPKSAHLVRRWHGHPVFPTLLGLGGVLEVRSNWSIYVREFSLALGILGRTAPEPQRIAPSPGSALTPFEAKYQASGHDLWRIQSED